MAVENTEHNKDIVRRAIAKNPEDRFSDGEAMAMALTPRSGAPPA